MISIGCIIHRECFPQFTSAFIFVQICVFIGERLKKVGGADVLLQKNIADMVVDDQEHKLR
jgi:hypothetical protein